MKRVKKVLMAEMKQPFSHQTTKQTAHGTLILVSGHERTNYRAHGRKSIQHQQKSLSKREARKIFVFISRS